MSKKNIEKEKIRKANRRMTRLRKRYYEITDKLGYLRSLLKNHEDLINRDRCPLCRGIIDSIFYENEIPIIKSRIAFLEAWIKRNYNYSKRCKITKPIINFRNEERKNRTEKVRAYLSKNINIINKTIRTLSLPNINTNDEKELWNEAIRIQLDKRGMTENNDMEFEILN